MNMCEVVSSLRCNRIIGTMISSQVCSVSACVDVSDYELLNPLTGARLRFAAVYRRLTETKIIYIIQQLNCL